MPSNVLSSHLKQTFPPKIWNFNEGEGDGIKSRLPFKNVSTWHMIPFWLVWADIECIVRVALSKRPINHFKVVQQSRQQVLRAYCPNIRTVIFYIRLESFSANDRLVEKET